MTSKFKQVYVDNGIFFVKTLSGPCELLFSFPSATPLSIDSIEVRNITCEHNWKYLKSVQDRAGDEIESIYEQCSLCKRIRKR